MSSGNRQPDFSSITYTKVDEDEMKRWLSVSTDTSTSLASEGDGKTSLKTLNDHLSTRTTLLGSKPSAADITLYHKLKPIVENWTPEERTGEQGYHHVVRYIDFVQNSPLFGLVTSEEQKVKIDVDDVRTTPKAADPKEEKARKKKEKAVLADAEKAPNGPNKDESAGLQNRRQDAAEERSTAEKDGASQIPLQHRPKREKQHKAAKAPSQKEAAAAPALSPSLIDLRVGHILKAINHPNADSLYVSTIACGDSPGTENTSSFEDTVVRTVCSGLNGLVPLEEMQGRKVVVVCNLKPVTMRGIKSSAMVLAASPRVGDGEEDGHKGPVELVTPPADAKAGERVLFEGWEGKPEGVLNPKKKIWETLQPGFTTTAQLEVGFDVSGVPQLAGDGQPAEGKGGISKLKTESGGLCTVKTLKGAVVR